MNALRALAPPRLRSRPQHVRPQPRTRAAPLEPQAQQSCRRRKVLARGGESAMWTLSGVLAHGEAGLETSFGLGFRLKTVRIAETAQRVGRPRSGGVR
jgi:hypothetical protein